MSSGPLTLEEERFALYSFTQRRRERGGKGFAQRKGEKEEGNNEQGTRNKEGRSGGDVPCSIINDYSLVIIDY
ncbi:hypothetical protein SY85_16790 [Flavisolibacter tropicus]|uniref:Uncharacterized protein n=1 Tax=Flavisolibacter tropicus TaxID=1492898 RepID=A0A172TYP6_9BACT|nr:hypothetical protein SY85_16790 [Flavisolibacter tropicus]